MHFPRGNIFSFIVSLVYYFFEELAPPGVVPPRRLYLRGSISIVSHP